MRRFILPILLLLCSIPAMASDEWHKIIIVKPEVIIVGSHQPTLLQQMQRISDAGYDKAVEQVINQLPRYYPVQPKIEFYSKTDFYQRLDGEGSFFLKQLAPQGQNDLVLSGHFEFDVDTNKVTVQIDGYDGNNKTDWLVLMSPFSQKSLGYLEEIYIQLIFDLLNEPTTHGLKPLEKVTEAGQ